MLFALVRPSPGEVHRNHSVDGQS